MTLRQALAELEAKGFLEKAGQGVGLSREGAEVLVGAKTAEAGES